MTKNYTTSDTLGIGQYTEHRGNIYVAVKRKRNKPCIVQCDALLGDRCKGICYRFANYKDFVLKEVDMFPENTTFVETEFGKASRLYLEEIKKQMLNNQNEIAQ